MLPQSASQKCHCSGIKRPVSPLVPFPSSRGLRPLLLNSSCSVYTGLSTSILFGSAHPTDCSSPVRIPRSFAYVLRSLIWSWESKLASFLALCSMTSKCVSIELLLLGPLCLAGSLPVSLNLCGYNPLCPHDHGALGQSFLKPALPVLSVLSEIWSWLEVMGTFLCTKQPSEWPGLIWLEVDSAGLRKRAFVLSFAD